MEPNVVDQSISPKAITKPIFFRIVYWLALLEGVFFTTSIIPYFSGRIPLSPELIRVVVFENLLFGIPLIVTFFGLRKMKIWGLYSVFFILVADIFTIITNLDGASRGQGSFIMLGVEIVITLYLVYRFKNPSASNKWV